LLRSPTTLLTLLALIVIAGFLLYTYLSSERGVEASDPGTQLSSEDADLVGDPQTDPGPASTGELMEPLDAADSEDGAAPEPEPAASSTPEPAPPPAARPAPRPAPPRAAAPEARPEVADRPEAPPALKSETEAEADAADTVQAFYSALSAGDGASAARFVIPAKRGSGPLSAGALTRYYSSFRRPLRLRRVVPVNGDTVRVAYDYVLADGRVCRGQAAVDVVHRGGRSLVSGIRTRGPC
jgi:outer membrane biosynthesis protein TonB